MDTIVLENPQGDKLTVTPYAAHVLSWETRNNEQQLFLSEQAIFTEGKAIRGGVPVIFPQFNEFGPVQRHGFARNQMWQVSSQSDTHIVLTLSANPTTKQLWPYDFIATYRVELGDQQIVLSLQVENRDTKSFEFTSALHTYLAVNQLGEAQLSGLDNHSFWSNDGGSFSERQTETSPQLTFLDTLETGIDRVYFAVKKPLILQDGKKSLAIAMTGFDDVVVWNPGAEAVTQMADMSNEEYARMLCVEAARIDNPIKLNPEESWCGSQTLSLQSD